jgi:hypothetical protein
MKTAMQELLELCKHYQATFQNPIGEIVKKIESELLEKEKEQMLNVFEESRITHPMIGFKHETFKDYYSETFNTNEK